MADKENKADLIGGINIKTQDQHVRAPAGHEHHGADQRQPEAGSAVLGEIGNVGKLHKGQVEQAGFAVLKAPDIPSVLVETAFISNPDEEAKLRSERVPGTAGRCRDARHHTLLRAQSAAGAQPPRRCSGPRCRPR
jgi:N-acetylmuramoyl-L-alanine amidase